MKRVGLFLFLLLTLNLVAFSQDKENEREDFNGTWIIDKEKSSNYGKAFDNYFLVISFKDNKFKVTKVFVSGKKAATYEITFATDKTGEKNTYTGLDGRMERKSKTYWQKNTLVSEFKITPEHKRYTFGGTERYYLSKDGKKLFFESVQTSPVVPLFIEDILKSRLVFKRKEPKT
jgi:hypothetical protein